jgi:DNA-binding HxlR family transcriptional regulator
MGQPKRGERGLNPGTCPLTTAVSVIAPKWAAAIWYQLSKHGAGGRRSRRTEDLRRAIPGITRKMLVEQLRQFEVDGVVARMVKPSKPPQVEYSLTQHGRDLWKIWDAMWHWGTAHLELRQTPQRV